MKLVLIFLSIVSFCLQVDADEVDDLYLLMVKKENLKLDFEIAAKTFLLTDNLVDKHKLNSPEVKLKIDQIILKYEAQWKTDIRQKFTKNEITYLNKLYQLELMDKFHSNSSNFFKKDQYKDIAHKVVNQKKESNSKVTNQAK